MPLAKSIVDANPGKDPVFGVFIGGWRFILRQKFMHNVDFASERFLIFVLK